MTDDIENGVSTQNMNQTLANREDYFDEFDSPSKSIVNMSDALEAGTSIEKNKEMRKI